MEKREANTRLKAISDMIDTALNNKQPMLMSTYHMLETIQEIALGLDQEEQPPVKTSEKLQHVIISCDASITENPGGQASVGFVIQYKDEPKVSMSQLTKAKSNNEGEYDAVYVALTTLMDLKHAPNTPIEVRSDSKLVVDQINGDMKCNKKELKRRRDLIRELIQSLPVPVTVTWRPRNSTPELEEANYLAQDALGVSRH